ncbi:hypothetical protein KA057_02310 [Candidatus Gracilibacteria bacterium]|nr:hypothetical protein [Candidatus Gracilibacteria bacterium]
MANKTNIKTPQELIDSSGNTMTIRVRDFLINHGWKTTLSSYYVDTMTSKTRENDIVAIKNFTCSDALGRNVFLSVALVIECKYITKNTVFWFDPMNIAMAQNSKNSHNQNTNYLGIHTLSLGNDYKPKEVAKLFEDGDTSGKPLFTGIDQCLHGLIFQRDRMFGSTKYFGGGRIFLEYPVLLVNSFDYFYNPKCEKIGNNFLFEVDYSYLKNSEVQNEYFLVDIVSEELLEDFMTTIEEDILPLKIGIQDCSTEEVASKFGV